MEGLRGVAVTLVFLQHYSVQSQVIGLSPGAAATFAAAFHAYGNFGVELFFVLSGYLIYGTLVRRAPNFISFMRRRYQQIYPAFLVVFAFTLAIILLVPIPGKIPPQPGDAMVYLAMNLALVLGLVPGPRIIDVAWSLSYEMFFYIATAGLVLATKFGNRLPRQRIATLVLLTAAFVLVSLADLPNYPVRMLPFFAGMLLAEGVGSAIPPWASWTAPAAAFIGLATQRLPGICNEAAQTFAFFALCAVCFRGAGIVSVWMTWAPLRWLGNMSYSYYLLHGIVVRIVMVMLARMLPAGMADWVFWAVMPGLFVATLVASSLLFIAVEKPLSLRPARPSVSAPATVGRSN